MNPPVRVYNPETAARDLAARPDRHDRLQHLEVLPGRPETVVAWPDWLPPKLSAAFSAAGVVTPWQHQVQVADIARHGGHVVVSTGTASGKTLAYLMPTLSAIVESLQTPGARGATVLYLAPTKALAHDQLASIAGLGVPGVRATAYDGDCTLEERDWAREHSNYLLTNPDMVHRTLLPSHPRWASFWGSLCYVVVDECHHYRGVFGAHVAQILRRLRRIAAHYGADPTFVLASATVAEPAMTASRLVGAPVVAVDRDTSPQGTTAVALWEPPLTSLVGELGAPVRRSATSEAADLVADLVCERVRTLAFVRSRRGAETVALQVQHALAEAAPELVDRVAPYRGGYLPEDRREVEAALRSGQLLAVSATMALEMGIDVDGLDAVVMAGFPGTRASMWQQIGRSGREGQGGLGVLVARDDPLDTFLVTHPETLLGAPVEATVFDPANPYVLAPHLCAAAQELPLTPADLDLFDGDALAVVESLVGSGHLRRRQAGWFWTQRARAADLADIRSTGGNPVRIVEAVTGRLMGTVDAAAAHTTVHTGAIYLHRGETYQVTSFDPVEEVAVVRRASPDFSTTAREVTELSIEHEDSWQSWGSCRLSFGTVAVSSQVVSYLKRRLATGEVLGEVRLDLPPRHLRTRAVWWTLSADRLAGTGLEQCYLPGAAHAAEHAAIGLLPLFATCDRWDIGGVSTAWHPDTGRLTVFVYDGHPGGAGFAERGFQTARSWLTATRDAVIACGCRDGCPSCVQSPKCGNANTPLHKRGAITLLTALLADACAADYG